MEDDPKPTKDGEVTDVSVKMSVYV